MPLSDILGHRRLTTLLAQAIARETLPPTLLFAGPSGIGKFQVARAVAQAVNCLTPVRDREGLAIDACGQCRSCERIPRGVHVDVLTLSPDDKASIKIDVVREVLERTAFRPFEGRRRVVIIRDADTLEVQAQNALLKSLEEPPPSTVFILTTAIPGALLPTVRSRCMRLRFGRLPEREVADLLLSRHEFSERDAREAAALSDGSVAQALALGSTDLAVVRESALLLLQQAARTPAVSARIQTAGVLATTPARKERTREELKLVLRMASSMLRDLELLNTTSSAQGLANGAVAGELQAVARAYAGPRAREAFVVVDKAIAALERNAGIKVVSEWLAVQI